MTMVMAAQGLLPSAPLSIQLHPSNRCNANCRFCWLHDRDQTVSELPDKRWLELVEEIRALDIGEVTISGGGEPLMRAELVLELMERLSNIGIEGNLITNGMLITEEFARRAVEMHWNSIQVSIHGHDSSINDSIMDKKGAFDLALRGIRLLNDCKSRAGSNLPKLTLRFVVTRSNFLDLPDFIGLAESLGASVVSIRMVNDHQTVVWGEQILTTEENRGFLTATREARLLARDAGIAINFEFDLPGKEEDRRGLARKEREYYCHLPFSELVVFANGRVSSCCNFFSSQFTGEQVGWVEDLNQRPLREIWEKGFGSLRGSMLPGQQRCETCERCSPDMHHKRELWPESFFHRRFQHLRQGDRLKEGVDLAEEQLRDHPENAVLHHYIGEFHMELEEYDKAISYLSRAVELDPKMEWTHFSLGKCFYLTGRYEKAEKAFKDNLRLTTERLSHFHSWFFLAMAANTRNDKKGCRKALKGLKGLSEFIGNEIPLEKEFLAKLKKEKRLPA